MKSILSFMIFTFPLLLVLGFCSGVQPAAAQFVEKNNAAPTAKVVEQQDTFDIIVGVINFLFALAFLMSIGGFIYAGVRYIIAGGSEGILEKATGTWVASLIGLIISLVGYILLNVVKHYIR